MSYFSTINFPPANMGAFGDLEVSEITPLIQWSFATGYRDQLITSSSSGGTVDTLNGRLRWQTSTGASDYAIAQSTRPAAYRAGQGITARFTPTWATSATDSIQYFGMGTTEDGYFFGYSGSNFGIIHRASTIDTFISQSAWNGDTCNGSGPSGVTLNHTYGTPLMVKYPYLGYGNALFYVQNPTSSAWIHCHTIQYANSSALPQVSNPNLSVYGEVRNAGNTTNLTMYLGSVGVFLDGPREYLGPQYAVDATKTTITAEVPVITIKSATVINGVKNRALARLRSVSYAADAGASPNSVGISTLRIKKTATVSSGTAYMPVDSFATSGDGGTSLTGSNSVMSWDTGSAALSGGYSIFNALVAKNTSTFIDCTPFNIFIAPGEILTFSISAVSSIQASVAINWQEDVQ